ncbi:MAG TPA: G5 domain-containing protein [Candidatus Saccharimonadales bacterium]|nr:G5 domain-containing protein [Candidatus Saccharimonadales bacterium]
MQQKLRRLNRTFVIAHRRRVRRLKVLSRHPFAVPITAFAVLLTLTGGTVWWVLGHGGTFKPAETDLVIISHDHQTQIVPSHEPTVGALLSKLHISVNRGDVVEPSIDTPINQDDFRINIYRAAPVKIVEGDTVTTGLSAATTPRSIARQAGVTVYPEDKLTTAPVSNFLKQGALGSVITVNQSTPVTLTINGIAAPTRTLATTVGAFLAEKHITPGQSVHVTPGVDTPITPGITVAVLRDGTGLQSETQDIPVPVQYVNDDSLAYGTFATRQQGSAGQQVLTYRITVQHGQVVSKDLVQTVVTVQAVTQIVARGTNLSGIKGDMARAGISPDDYQYADYIISRESGWCPTKWQGEYGGCPAYHGTPGSAGVGYGLCQATPGYKMASAGDDWATNPITQLKWCTSYAQRYGGWYGAYTFWVSHHYW